MSRWIDVASAFHLTPGSHREFDVYGYSVAVFNIGGEYYAIKDACPSDGVGLSGGEVKGEEIVCPRHGERYSVKSGAVLGQSSNKKLDVFPVRVSQGKVQIEVEIGASHYL